MTTTLRILGWKAKGLRCPDHEIELLGGRDRLFGVSLIQMPNGTGKTTTLELLPGRRFRETSKGGRGLRT